MISSGAQKQIHLKFTTVKIVWFALLMANLMYAFVASRTTGEAQAMGELNPASTFYMFVMISVVTAGASFLLPMVIANFSHIPGESTEPTTHLTDEAIGKKLQRWFVIQIVRYALNDAIAVYGLVFTILNGSMSRQSYFFFVLAVLLQLASYPQRSKFFEFAGVREPL